MFEFKEETAKAAGCNKFVIQTLPEDFQKLASGWLVIFDLADRSGHFNEENLFVNSVIFTDLILNNKLHDDLPEKLGLRGMEDLETILSWIPDSEYSQDKIHWLIPLVDHEGKTLHDAIDLLATAIKHEIPKILPQLPPSIAENYSTISQWLGKTLEWCDGSIEKEELTKDNIWNMIPDQARLFLDTIESNSEVHKLFHTATYMQEKISSSKRNYDRLKKKAEQSAKKSSKNKKKKD